MSRSSLIEIEEYLDQVKQTAGDLSVAQIEKAVGILFEAWENGHTVYACGNGGSASTATHFACDLSKTVACNGNRGFRAESLVDNIPLVLALVNDDGFENLFVEQLITKFRPGDVLICISVHGGAGKDNAGLWSQNLLKAMKYVNDNGGKTIGLSGFDGGPMKDIAHACMVVPVNSTPLVESFHLVLEHLICSCLKEMIGSYGKSGIPR